ncbi:choice-of-anchor A family protein [Herbaspirillum lusitanum]|jgi:choice-of-anchor A domain-containing protein|uniref:Choice-of-anchor A family protein n=1 Tax=Herbaspirillum lusitanum TaxID=213312 RepID=A0ABW9A442_9BURK
MRILKALVLLAAALGASASYAAALTASQILSQFNVVVSTTLTSGHDIEGRVVADEITGGATFYNNPSNVASSYGAITANKIDSFNANINNGGSVAYKNSDSAHFNLNGGGTVTQNASFSLSDFTAPLNALSVQLSQMTANSTVNGTDPNNFTFVETANSSGTAVFSVTTAQLAAARNLLFSGSATTIIINVTGSSFNQTANFNASAFLNANVIWNFVDATNLSFTNWHGAVLAGNAAVTNSSAMEGFLYAKSFTGNGELHDRPFTGTLPASTTAAVPEPSSYPLILLGLVMLVLATRVRASQRKSGGLRPVAAS